MSSQHKYLTIAQTRIQNQKDYFGFYLTRGQNTKKECAKHTSAIYYLKKSHKLKKQHNNTETSKQKIILETTMEKILKTNF